jgi:hypothetical protein
MVCVRSGTSCPCCACEQPSLAHGRAGTPSCGWCADIQLEACRERGDTQTACVPWRRHGCAHPSARCVHRVEAGGARHHGTAPQDGRPGAQISGRVPASWRWPCVCLAGLALYPEADLERLQVEVRFGHQFLEASVLTSRSFRRRASSASMPPYLARQRGLTEPALAADILDRQARLGLLQEPDDLLLRESTLPHVRHSPG